MTEQPDGNRSRLRSRAQADALAAEYEASGLSRQEFCRQRNGAFKTLARDIVQRRKRTRVAPSAGSSRLVRVQVEPRPEAARALTVTLAGGRRIVVQAGFAAGLLRPLLTVLEQS